MHWRSILLHLRFPFSYFLMPVFLLALAISPNLEPNRLLEVFLILHVLLYPASNAFNSYYDRDEGSIGLLQQPPKIKGQGLLIISLAFDIAAILWAYSISFTFALLVLGYGLASKAYSHPAIRWKANPLKGWLAAGFFQGAFTFWMVYCGINDYSLSIALYSKSLIAGLLCTVFLFGFFPLTQVYQHEEDQKREDKTMSVFLGVKGTFWFALAWLSAAIVGFIWFFRAFYLFNYYMLFIGFTLPALVYFLFWMRRVMKDPEKADYRRTMRFCWISASCLNLFFLYIFLESTHVMQWFFG